MITASFIIIWNPVTVLQTNNRVMIMIMIMIMVMIMVTLHMFVRGQFEWKETAMVNLHHNKRIAVQRGFQVGDDGFLGIVMCVQHCHESPPTV